MARMGLEQCVEKAANSVVINGYVVVKVCEPVCAS